MVTNDDVQLCPCCRLDCYPGETDFDGNRRAALHPNRGLCWDCVNHQGDSDAVKKARAGHHFKMLRREYERMKRELTTARDAVEESERELAKRPVVQRVRVENLDAFMVRAAHQDRDDAVRRRNIAMGALSDIRILHHRDPDNREKCSCKQAYERCQEAQIADSWEGVVSWERSQAGAAYRNERHYLRADHPALTDRNYLRSVYGA